MPKGREEVDDAADRGGTERLPPRRAMIRGKEMTMKRSMIAAALFSLALPLVAATKTYQVTGPVLEVKPDVVVVQKGSERWEVARDGSTKITGDLKVGAKVTIEYRMTATSITIKPEAAAKKK
jgi:hypothetical protein